MTLAARLWSHVKDAEHAVVGKVRSMWSSAKPKIVSFYKKEKEAIRRGGTHLREFYQAKKKQLLDHLHKEKKVVQQYHVEGKITMKEVEAAHKRIDTTIADIHKRHEQNLAGMHKPQESFTEIPDADVKRHEPLGIFQKKEEPVVETVTRQTPTPQPTPTEPSKPGLVLGQMARDTPQRALRHSNRATYNQTFYIKGGGRIDVRRHTRRTKKGVIPVCKHIRNVKKTTKKVTRRCKR